MQNTAQHKGKNEDRTVRIEYCVNCKEHSWCTIHDDARYFEHFQKLAEMIHSVFPNLIVRGNDFSHKVGALIPYKLSDDPKKASYYRDEKGQNYCFPQIGAFEVEFRGKLLFSKIKLGVWPRYVAIIQKIEDMIDGKEVRTYEKYDRKQNEADTSSGFDKQKSRSSNSSKIIMPKIKGQKEGSQFDEYSSKGSSMLMSRGPDYSGFKGRKSPPPNQELTEEPEREDDDVGRRAYIPENFKRSNGKKVEEKEEESNTFLTNPEDVMYGSTPKQEDGDTKKKKKKKKAPEEDNLNTVRSGGDQVDRNEKDAEKMYKTVEDRRSKQSSVTPTEKTMDNTAKASKKSKTKLPEQEDFRPAKDDYQETPAKKPSSKRSIDEEAPPKKKAAKKPAITDNSEVDPGAKEGGSRASPTAMNKNGKKEIKKPPEEVPEYGEEEFYNDEPVDSRKEKRIPKEQQYFEPETKIPDRFPKSFGPRQEEPIEKKSSKQKGVQGTPSFGEKQIVAAKGGDEYEDDFVPDKPQKKKEKEKKGGGQYEQGGGIPDRFGGNTQQYEREPEPEQMTAQVKKKTTKKVKEVANEFEDGEEEQKAEVKKKKKKSTKKKPTLDDIEYPDEKTLKMSLMVNAIQKKKISLMLKDEGIHQITVVSSDPDELILADNYMAIEGPAKFKIPIRFAETDTPMTRIYKLYVFIDNEPWTKLIFETEFSYGDGPEDD